MFMLFRTRILSGQVLFITAMMLHTDDLMY
jgi:hypothetical protein